MRAHMADPVTPFGVFTASGGIASLAGLAALLRSGKPLTVRSVISAVLNSGIMGFAIAGLWYSYFQGNTYFLIGMCALGGLGGTTFVDFAVQVLKTVIAKQYPNGKNEQK